MTKRSLTALALMLVCCMASASGPRKLIFEGHYGLPLGADRVF